MLAGYADDELTAVEREAVAAHLEACGRCRQLVLDQQRLQHVLESYTPPPVPEERWEAMGKRLRAELQGTGLRAVLKTRPRIEALEPERTEPPAGAEDPTPLPAAWLAAPGAAAARPGAAARPRAGAAGLAWARRPRFGWMAHVAGAVAAGFLLLVGLLVYRGPDEARPEPRALALQKDVEIMEVQMVDPGYTVVLMVGDATDVAAIWVVPTETN
jgi:anti-sigma factor RsiW